MKAIPATNVEQWVVLQTAVEAGSFAKAAALLNRSQSSISYAISKLQEGLGIELLRTEGRRAVLTEAGQLLLAEAVPLIDEFRRLEARGRMLAAGQELRVRVVVGSITPKAIVFAAFARFRAAFDGVEIVLRELVRQPLSSLDVSDYDLAISFWEDRSQHAYRFAEVEMIAVVRNDHPLALQSSTHTSALMARYPIVIIDPDDDRRRALPTGQHLRVNSLDAAVEAVRSGFCHGRLPRHMIEEDLKAGHLVPLSRANGVRIIPLVLAFAHEEMAGPLTRAMAGFLREESERYRNRSNIV